MAWATILASTWRGLAPSAIRNPISRVRRDTLIDISEKSPMADRNNTSALTPANAATPVLIRLQQLPDTELVILQHVSSP
jgi:hypothetical protein